LSSPKHIQHHALKVDYTRSILFFLLLLSSPATAQSEQTETYLQERLERRDFNKQRWEELTRDLQYPTADPEREQQDKKENQQNAGGGDRRGGSGSFGGDASGAISVLLILLLAVALAVILGILINRRRPRNRRVKSDGATDLQQIRENIYETDLQRLIREAKEGGEYERALRLYYLELLKQLSLRRFIRWKKDKTNREYLQEMHTQAQYQDFEQLTRAFERIIYGGQGLDPQRFGRLEALFQDFLETLGAQTVAKP